MSRKKQQSKQTPPVDTGGLDLTITAVPGPAIVVEPKVFDLAHGLPPVAPATVDKGFSLYDALQESSYLNLAARRTANPDIVVVSNGRLFWTAKSAGLDPAEYPNCIDYDTERIRIDWRPVVGTEKGLTIA